MIPRRHCRPIGRPWRSVRATRTVSQRLITASSAVWTEAARAGGLPRSRALRPTPTPTGRPGRHTCVSECCRAPESCWESPWPSSPRSRGRSSSPALVFLREGNRGQARGTDRAHDRGQPRKTPSALTFAGLGAFAMADSAAARQYLECGLPKAQAYVRRHGTVALAWIPSSTPARGRERANCWNSTSLPDSRSYPGRRSPRASYQRTGRGVAIPAGQPGEVLAADGNRREPGLKLR